MRPSGLGARSVRLALMCLALLLAVTACGGLGGATNNGSGGGSGGGSGSGDYPTKPIKFIVPYAPGGTTDPLARKLTELLEPKLDARFIVENVPGAAGAVGTERILTAPADGYTIGLTTGSALFVAPKTTEGVSYSGPQDWSVIAKMSATPYLLVVRKDAPWQSFEDVLERAKSRKVTVSTPGAFNPGDLVLEQLNAKAGDVFRATPFSGGGGEALAAVLGGQVEAGVAALSTARGQLEAGELRALAVFADKPLQLKSTVPAITDLGYDATLNADFFVIAPPGLPANVAQELTRITAEVVKSPEFGTFVEGTGALPTPLDAAAAAADLQKQEKVYNDLFTFLKDRDRLKRG